jgi:hypothetical protein
VEEYLLHFLPSCFLNSYVLPYVNFVFFILLNGLFRIWFFFPFEMLGEVVRRVGLGAQKDKTNQKISIQDWFQFLPVT